MRLIDTFAYKITMTFILPILMMIGLYFLMFHEYKHESVVGMKLYEAPELYLRQYKQADLLLTPEEFASLSLTYPDKTYISDPCYWFMIDGKKVSVSNSIYNSYKEGDSIVYYKSLLTDFITLKK